MLQEFEWSGSCRGIIYVETCLQGVIQMFALLCRDLAPGLPAGGIQGPDRQETAGLIQAVDAVASVCPTKIVSFTSY